MTNHDNASEEPKIVASGGWCAPSETIYDLGAYGLGLGYEEIMNRTPEEWAAVDAEHKARVGAEMVVATARWSAARTLAFGASDDRIATALRSIVERHKPEAGSYNVECGGCPGDSEYGQPAWPCDDFNDIARAVGL